VIRSAVTALVDSAGPEPAAKKSAHEERGDPTASWSATAIKMRNVIELTDGVSARTVIMECHVNQFARKASSDLNARSGVTVRTLLNAIT